MIALKAKPHLDSLLSRLTFQTMNATLTSKGQITIPLGIRRKLGLKAGHVLEFDESAPYLKAVRAIDPGAWEQFGRKAKSPWPGKSSREIVDDMRGGVELPSQHRRK